MGILAGLLTWARPGVAQPQILNAIAVRVGQEVITLQEIHTFIGPELQLLERQYGGRPEILRQKMREAEKAAIEKLIENKLILNDFSSSGFSIPEKVIEDTVRDRIRTGFGDRATLMKTLQARGITYEDFRKEVREDIILRAMRRHHIPQNIVISPSRISEYYESHKDDFKQEERVKLRMIMITQPEGAVPDSAAKKATEILFKLDEGASFEEMAKQFSQGSQAAEGGDWGWVERKTLRQDLADVAFQLSPGQRSGVIATPTACFILKVEDKKFSDFKPLVEAREEIEKILQEEEQERLHKRYVERLRKKALVIYY